MIYLKEGNFPLNFAYDDNIVQEKNNTYQLSFKFPTNKPLWESLTEETLLLADDLHGEQEFIIFEVERHHGYITIYANQVATLLNNYSISELSVSEADGNRVMRSLVSSIIRSHNFTFYSDIAARHSLNLKNVTVATALFKDKHSILGQWGGDLVRDKYSIKLLANGGNNNEALFMYKKNLKTYQQKKSTKDLRTRIHFTKTINAKNDGEQDKVLSVTVDSPLINKYKNIYEGNLEVNDQDVVDEASLLNYAKQYYKNTLCDILEESIEIDVIGVDTPVKMFDTVTIFHEKFNLDVKKKITKYTFSPMSKKLKTIGFGVFQQGLGSALSSIIDEVVTVKVESKVDAFKIQKNLAELLKKDRTAIEEKMKTLEEQSKAGVEVKKALFEKDGTVPEVTRTKILDAIEAEIARLKTIITEAELIKAIQARLNYAEIKTALIDKAFIDKIISNETFRQQFEAGEVTTQNIFTKMRDSIQSSIKKEFITKEETKRLVNDLTIGADGIRQITQEETNKIFDLRKPELKGKDGKVPAFNQLIGTRFPTLAVVKPVGSTVLKLNKKDYKDQNSIEVLPNAGNEVQGFSMKANIRDVAAGKMLVLRIPVYIYSDSSGHELISMGWPDESNNVDLFQSLPLINGTSKKDEWQLIEMQFPISNDSESKSFVQNRIALVSFGSIHFKVAEPYMAVDEKPTDKWLPAIEDMQSYSLTASARIEGSYLNENLANCKVYLDVYNNGEIIRASTTETPLKIEIKKLVASGYTATGEVTLDSNGLVQNINIPNGTKDGQPIEVVFEVTCGENKTVASARLNNTIDKQLLTETISKVKTFESTIDKFESKIGEINKQKFKMAYNIENICSESGVEKKGNDLYFNAKTPLKKDKEYYILADLEDVPENQNTRLYNAKGNGDSKIISNGSNIWRVSYASDQTRVNIYPLGTNTKVKNVEIYEVPEFENPKENLIKTTNADLHKKGNITIETKEPFAKDKIHSLEFEIAENVDGWMISSYFNGVSNIIAKKKLIKGLNKLSLRGDGVANTLTVGIPPNLTVSNLIFYKENFETGYKNEYNISEMESKINQTKDQIEQSVKKNEFGTVLTQNAQYLKLAWNNISKYIQFENAGMSFYEGGQVNDNKLVARLNDSGYQMWRDGYYLGSIGTNSYKQDRSKKGIQFDLNYDGWFMGWAYQTSRNADAYTWKWVYSSGNFATYKADTLNAGCDIDMQNNEIKNVILKSTNITVWDGENGTFRFSLPVSFQSDGRAYQWHDNCYLTFKNGLLIDSSMPR
ncbi:phage tail spike protein [Gemella morbillorum]|uniref:phage tail spike protein n=1 Tax=Gemella morbillorum TaxID=29391 RepID=UPI0028D83CAC|nr:phage tail spike protein [Gemella morbillorum]